MSRLLLFCLLLLPLAALKAQSGFGDTRATLGVTAGPDFSNQIQHYTTSFAGGTYTNYSFTGLTLFHVGLMYQYFFGRRELFHPRLLLSALGIRVLDNGEQDMVYYLRMPLPFGVRFPTRKGILFAEAGPYLSVGLGGHVGPRKLSFGNNPNGNDLTNGDWGVFFSGGLELDPGWMFALEGGLGLGNVQPGGDANNYIYNRYWGVSLGYFFR